MQFLISGLNYIERQGNKLPHPTQLFIYLCTIIILSSCLVASLGGHASHPSSGELIQAKSLMSAEGLHYILLNTIKNFTQFAAVGSVLVAMLGLAVAEHSGLLASVLRASILRAPPAFTTFSVVLASVLSSLAMDTGYVVLIPLAAMIFKASGRNPLAGIVASFAGVSGGFSANLLVGPVDAILGGLSTEAARIIEPSYTVGITANYYFIVASTLLIACVGTFVTEKIIARWLPAPNLNHQEDITPIAHERKGLIAVGAVTLAMVIIILLGLIPEQGFLRNPETSGILDSPFMKGIVVFIAFYAAISGWAFSRFSGNYRGMIFVIEAMEKNMALMASYIVLMFFAAQFVNYFNWSNMGTIVAIHGADLLGSLSLPKPVLIIAFIFTIAFLNLFIGSASAKWGLIAPIFIPMFYLLNISPEATQMAYRIGDSTTNIITPLMPYFGIVVAFAQQHNNKMGMGTLISAMLPYSLFFLFSWTALLSIWIIFDLPLGPGATIFVQTP